MKGPIKIRWLLIIGLAVGPALAADTEVLPRSTMGNGFGCGGPPTDGSRELYPDNGEWKYLVWWYTGRNSWVGNEFEVDIAGINPYYRITKLKVFSSTSAPNDEWDGFRIGIFEYIREYEIPGAMLWPTSGTGFFFTPTGAKGHVWIDVPVAWATTETDLVAAMEQVYNPPDCDPFAVDSNLKDQERSWSWYAGEWKRLHTKADPYCNLMLRMCVTGFAEYPAVAPTSFGRVKALYH